MSEQKRGGGPVLVRKRGRRQFDLRRPAFLILGHEGHGVSRVAATVRDRLGLAWIDTDEVAARLAVFPELRFKYRYISPAHALEDRKNRPEEWAAAVARYNRENPARLVRAVLRSSHIYAGLKSQREFEASFELFDLVVWVDASARVGPDPLMEIEFDPVLMVRIDNNGLRDELPGRVARELGPTLGALRQKYPPGGDG